MCVGGSFGQPRIVYIITFSESIFLPKRNKKHMLGIVYDFLGFLGYCQTCIMRAEAQQSFPLLSQTSMHGPAALSSVIKQLM